MSGPRSEHGRRGIRRRELVEHHGVFVVVDLGVVFHLGVVVFHLGVIVFDLGVIVFDVERLDLPLLRGVCRVGPPRLDGAGRSLRGHYPALLPPGHGHAIARRAHAGLASRDVLHLHL